MTDGRGAKRVGAQDCAINAWPNVEAGHPLSSAVTSRETSDYFHALSIPLRRIAIGVFDGQLEVDGGIRRDDDHLVIDRLVGPE